MTKMSYAIRNFRLSLFIISSIMFCIKVSASAPHCLSVFQKYSNQTRAIRTNAKSLTESVLENNSSEHIGELIVNRHRKVFENNDPALNSPKGVDYMSPKFKIAMAIRDEALYDRVKDDSFEFLNYHQTNRTNGESTIRQRQDVEDSLVQLSLGTTDKSSEVRPKSAYLFLGKQFPDTDLGQTTIRSNYGEFYAVMKNDIKKRALFSLHDSLAASRLFSFSIKPEKPLSTTKDMMGDYTAYFEAVIYGKLTKEDVDYWIVAYDRAELKETLSNSTDLTLHQLLKSGQKVYTAKWINVNGRSEITKGSLIKLP